MAAWGRRLVGPGPLVLRLVVALVLVLGSALIVRPYVRGDGWQYLYMMRALRETGSVRFSEAANASLTRTSMEQDVGHYPDDMDERLADGVRAGEARVEGFVRNGGGDYHALHPPLYPALAVPLDWLLEWKGLNPLRALQVLNALFVLGALGYVYRLSRLSPGEKDWVALGFLTCGTSYYLLWPHPEVFAGSLLLVALLAWRDARPAVAIACAALASSYVPALALLVPVILVVHLVGVVLARSGTVTHALLAPRQLAHYALMVVAGSPALLAPLFFWTHYGQPSLPAEDGVTDFRLISFDRFLSFWFDLNQGIVMANLPFMLLGLGLAACLLVAPSAARRKAVLLAWPAALLAMGVALVLSALSQTNWNAACTVMIRHGYWAFIPIMLALVLATRLLGPRTRQAVLGVTLALQCVLVGAHGVFALDYSHTRFTPLSQWLMARRPGAYNPMPEVFAERATGQEAFDPTAIYSFLNTGGSVTKVLMPLAKAPAADILTLSTPTGELDKTGDFSMHRVGDMAYLNGTFIPHFPLGQELPFNSPLLGWEGWSEHEAAWRWNMTGSPVITLPAIQPLTLKEGVLTLRCAPYRVQTVTLRINGTEVYSGKLEKLQTLEIPFDRTLLRVDGANRLEFELPGAERHPEIRDPRPLAISFVWMMLR